MVYLGSFYEDIRNPRNTLELFYHVCKRDSSIVVHVLGYGCEDILEEYRMKMGRNLVLHGRLSKESADDMVCSANVLLNISNTCKTQTPSKLMEYIGTGKPIINMFCIDGDVGEKYLKDYPLHYSIDTRTEMNRDMIKNVSEFIIEKQNDVFTETEERYAKWSAEKFASFIKI